MTEGNTVTTAPMTDPVPGRPLAVLLDALDGVPLSDGERASLTWLAGFEVETVQNIAAVIGRARAVGAGDPR